MEKIAQAIAPVVVLVEQHRELQSIKHQVELELRRPRLAGLGIYAVRIEHAGQAHSFDVRGGSWVALGASNDSPKQGAHRASVSSAYQLAVADAAGELHAALEQTLPLKSHTIIDAILLDATKRARRLSRRPARGAPPNVMQLWAGALVVAASGGGLEPITPSELSALAVLSGLVPTMTDQSRWSKLLETVGAPRRRPARRQARTGKKSPERPT